MASSCKVLLHEVKKWFFKKIFSFFSKLGVISRSRSFLGTWGHFWCLFIHAYNSIKVLQVWWHLRYFGGYWVNESNTKTPFKIVVVKVDSLFTRCNFPTPSSLECWEVKSYGMLKPDLNRDTRNLLHLTIGAGNEWPKLIHTLNLFI